MKIDKDFTDGFYRAILVDWLRQSKYKNNEKMQDYIMYEASYEDVILAVSEGKSFNKEATDANTAIAIKKAEDSSSIYMDLLAFLFGGMATESAAKKYGLTGEQLKSKGFKFMGGKRIGMATLRVGVGWIVAPAILVWLAKKVIFGTLRKLSKKCKTICEQKAPKNNPERNLSINICISKCKIQDLKRSMSQIKSQISQCDSKEVKNPGKCKTGLYKTIGQFTEILQKEELKLKNNMAKYQQKKTVIKSRTQMQQGANTQQQTPRG